MVGERAQPISAAAEREPDLPAAGAAGENAVHPDVGEETEVGRANAVKKMKKSPLAEAAAAATAPAGAGQGSAAPRRGAEEEPTARARAASGQLQRRPSGSLPVPAARQYSGPRTTCGGLLNQLRAMIAKPVPVVVVAGAAEGSAAYRITEGLADAARRSGLRLLVEELIGPAGRPLLQQRAGAGFGRAALVESTGSGEDGAERASDGGLLEPGENVERGAERGRAGRASGSGPRPLRPPSAIVPVPNRGNPTALEPVAEGSTLTRWFEQSGGGVDFIVIAAPPLDTSVEAALLARACDGLVIVVESEVTPRESLQRSVRLARASGCRLLGLVMSEPKPRLPSWWRRLISASTYRGTS
jgi:hypothetical protein